MRPGLYLVHKSRGATSFSIVRAFMDEIDALGLRKQLPVVHGGALDPFAEGALAVLVGQATALVDELHAAPKRYVAELAWGAETDTGDPGGTIVARGDSSKLDETALACALASFVGWTEQVPPATSNKRVDGERAYVRAHRGESVELKPERVLLLEAKWLSHALPESSTLELACKGGFYVRALARDLGRAVGARAHLRTLRRTAIGPWTDPDARVHILGEQLVPWLASRELSDDESLAIEQGRPLPPGRIDAPVWPLPNAMPARDAVRALYRGKLVALLAREEDRLEVRTRFRGGI